MNPGVPSTDMLPCLFEKQTLGPLMIKRGTAPFFSILQS